MRGGPNNLATRRLLALLALLSVLGGCGSRADAPATAAALETAKDAAFDAAPEDATQELTPDTAPDEAQMQDAFAPPDGSSVDTSIADTAASDTASDGSGDAVDGSDSTEPVGPWAEIGQGEFGFEPVSEASTVACNFGPQGSYHVWAAIRLHNIAPSAIQVEMQASMDGSRIGAGFASPLDTEWTLQPDGSADLFGQFLYLDFGIDFPARSDQPITLTAAVTGATLSPVFASSTGRFSCLQ